MKNESNELILLKKESNSNFDIFCPYFRICIDSPLTKLLIAIIQELIKLLIRNLQEICKTNFLLVNVFSAWGRFYPPMEE